MPIELTANTDTGAHLVATAEGLAEQLAARASEHDRERTYPFEAIESLKAAGVFAAPVPVELGGLGVSSAHDLVVASSRLARGDASVAIGVNMHLAAVQNMERRRQVAVAGGHERRARGFAASLQQIARERVVLAAAISERSQDLTRPTTVATSTDAGWRIDGAKVFCTMSPGATHLYASVRYVDGGGVERYAYAMVPTDAPGVTVHDDWDALGMRASGSNSVSFEGVQLPESGIRGGFRAGDPTPYIERNLMAGLFHASASLGIAESADHLSRRGLAQRINGHARPRMQVADNAIDLAAARIKRIESPVAGQADVLVVPDLEAGNMLAKSLIYLAGADAAGIVLGARVPIVLTSRADSVMARLASCAVAALLADARRRQPAKAVT